MFFSLILFQVPFLYPLTNTFMTASIYMTVAVAVNRCMDMSVSHQRVTYR